MPAEQQRKVAVSGVGIVSPGAVGAGPFTDMLRQGRSAVAPVERFDTVGLRSHSAALVTGFSPRDFIPVMKMRRMNGLSRLGVSTMKLALTDAGIEKLDGRGREVGVGIGTTFGPVQTSVDYMQEYIARGPSLAPPQLFAESVANAPGSHIAIEFGFRGFNITFTQRESSAMAAAMYSCLQLMNGTVGAAVAGGVEEMNEITFSVLDRIGALAHATPDGLDERLRPFDRRRNGIAVGEGGAMLLLQLPDAVMNAAQPPYGYFSGFGMARDATASISNWGTGSEAVVRAMKDAVADAELELSSIDAIWASANSSIPGDRVEARAIHELFGSAIPPVVATKGYFGEYAGGGAIHLASAFIGLREQYLPASVGFEESEEGVVLPVVKEGQALALRHVLVNSISAGGGIISAVISRNLDD